MNTTHPDFIVIDDDRTNNSICRKMIQMVAPGADIQTFFDPNAGLVHIQSSYGSHTANDAILLLDINMPTLFGWEVLDEFKKISGVIKQHFKIFMLSSSIDPADRQRSETIPMVSGYIEKPLTVLKIQAIVYQSKVIQLN